MLVRENRSAQSSIPGPCCPAAGPHPKWCLGQCCSGRLHHTAARSLPPWTGRVRPASVGRWSTCKTGRLSQGNFPEHLLTKCLIAIQIEIVVDVCRRSFSVKILMHWVGALDLSIPFLTIWEGDKISYMLHLKVHNCDALIILQ